MKRIGLMLIATLIIGVVTSASALTISPKFSYVGYVGIGAEFSPLFKITEDIDLMAEANWDFIGWYAASGYMYGEVNAVYNAQPFKMGEGKGAQTLNPYVGGGLILGFPVGSTLAGEEIGGGIGFGLFGGVTGRYDPYTWFAQLKYAYAPITYKWPFYLFDYTHNALGLGMEFGVRFPL